MALFDWSTTSGYGPSDYTARVLADANPSGNFPVWSKPARATSRPVSGGPSWPRCGRPAIEGHERGGAVAVGRGVGAGARPVAGGDDRDHDHRRTARRRRSGVRRQPAPRSASRSRGCARRSRAVPRCASPFGRPPSVAGRPSDAPQGADRGARGAGVPRPRRRPGGAGGAVCPGDRRHHPRHRRPGRRRCLGSVAVVTGSVPSS